MKDWKRLIVVLAALAMIVAACGGDDGDTDDTEAGADATTTTAAADGGGDDGADSGTSLLATVQERGTLSCGTNETLVGFGFKDAAGDFVGMDVDICKAVAAAVLGDAEAVSFEALTAAARFEAVNSGQVDILSRNTTFTQQRDTELGLDFGPTTYYDGQQVMGTGDLFTAASTVADLDGATVCTNAGTTTELNITEAANAAGATITLNTYEDFNIVMENFESGNCDAVTTDGSGLVARKYQAQEAGNADAEGWVIFPEVPISKEPLGPAWKQGDAIWGDVIRWTVYALIIAEELGVTSDNVDDLRADPPNGEVGRLLGSEGDFAEKQTAMGLPVDAFYQAIKQVGNYGEIFERHLAPLDIPRGLNALWSDGGIVYAPPAR